jgi:hypothetical protein
VIEDRLSFGLQCLRKLVARFVRNNYLKSVLEFLGVLLLQFCGVGVSSRLKLLSGNLRVEDGRLRATKLTCVEIVPVQIFYSFLLKFLLFDLLQLLFIVQSVFPFLKQKLCFPLTIIRQADRLLFHLLELRDPCCQSTNIALDLSAR